MKIYKISQSLNIGYDTYDSAVVCADNEEEARSIHPSDYATKYTWIESDKINEIRVEYLGEADENLKKGVILSSFNAG